MSVSKSDQLNLYRIIVLEKVRIHHSPLMKRAWLASFCFGCHSIEEVKNYEFKRAVRRKRIPLFSLFINLNIHYNLSSINCPGAHIGLLDCGVDVKRLSKFFQIIYAISTATTASNTLSTKLVNKLVIYNTSIFTTTFKKIGDLIKKKNKSNNNSDAGCYQMNRSQCERIYVDETSQNLKARTDFVETTIQTLS